MRTTATSLRLTLIALAAATVSAAAPVARHAHLVKSEPSANDTLAAAPKQLRLWFSEKVELPVSTVKLTDAAGTVKELGKLWSDASDSAPVVVAVSAPLAPGSYSIAWKVAAKDGHPATGTIAFVVKPAR